MTITAEVAIALVVGDNEDDIRFSSTRRWGPEAEAEEEGENEDAHGNGNCGREERFCNSHFPES